MQVTQIAFKTYQLSIFSLHLRPLDPVSSPLHTKSMSARSFLILLSRLVSAPRQTYRNSRKSSKYSTRRALGFLFKILHSQSIAVTTSTVLYCISFTVQCSIIIAIQCRNWTNNKLYCTVCMHIYVLLKFRRTQCMKCKFLLRQEQKNNFLIAD